MLIARNSYLSWPGRIPALVLALFFIVAVDSSAQLVQKDIDSLRAIGKQENWTFEVGLNEATQYSLDQLCGLKPPEGPPKDANFTPFEVTAALPASFNWKDSGGVTPIRNQGGCGSCWAFATVGPLECNIKIQDGISVDLSEQWLVSCNRNGWGCDGGWWGHDYHQFKTDPCGGTGAVMETDFPYYAADLPCGCPYEHKYFISSWGYVGSEWSTPPVNAMKQAILDYGPITVGVYVNDAFQAYRSGIFNSCEDGPINHGVVLVGWDDADGVWILRNSWGSGWGEDGYMRIRYACSQVGYNAAYVDYEGGIIISADTTVGWAPYDVSFSGTSGLDVQEWCWDFGDGDSAFVQSPVHTYAQPGMYDLNVQITLPDGVRTRSEPGYIMALADSMLLDPAVEEQAGVPFVIPLYGRNYVPVRYIEIPVEYPGDLGAVFDSFSTVGCRTEYFESQTYVSWDTYNRRKTFALMSSLTSTDNMLPAGDGLIAKLYFTIPPGADARDTTFVSLDGYNQFLPSFSQPRVVYQPVFNGAVVTLASCCSGVTGNVNCDETESVDISDLTGMVDYLFGTNAPLCCPAEADMSDGTGDLIDITDLTKLVNSLFVTFEPLSICH